MAYSDTAKTDNVAHSAAAFVSAFTTLTERFAKYRLYRRTLKELSRISPRELQDIGLSAHNLHATAYKAVYGTR